ncbi:MAG: FAD-binding protein [Desulfomonile tiedjei]|uniref:FAD-binding protein n=1 Tax=Desulfomonile tiedjei TaxID=2358 RepID=A0A9D6Z563_9BACT|nr:FAD-binding protein [Desulfomonile tiedjei]
MNNPMVQKLEELVGKGKVLSSEAELLCYSYDSTPLVSHKPDAVVRVASEEDLGLVLEFAAREGLPVTPRGSGTGLSGGSVPVKAGIVLLTTGMDRIIDVDENDLSVVVEPGVITANIHSAVEAKGLFYPPDPGSMKISTIGGNVAENAGGLRGLKYGITGDYLLSLDTYLIDGSRVSYGTKCVKDVAGYNLTKFMAGTEGTIGIFSKISLKLIPKPQTKKTFLALYDDIIDAARTVSAIISRKVIPSTLELMDSVTIECVEDHVKIGLPRDVDALLLIETDGHPEVVREEAAVIEEACLANKARTLRVAKDLKESEELFTARRNALSSLARVKPTTILEDVTVPRPAIPEMMATIREAAQKYAITIGTFGHAGDGNLHPTCLTDERNKEEIHRVEEAYEVIFAKAISLGGTISGEHGTGITKAKYLPKMVGPKAIEVMQRIKKAFDPQGRLNPGKIFLKNAE